MYPDFSNSVIKFIIQCILLGVVGAISMMVLEMVLFILRTLRIDDIDRKGLVQPDAPINQKSKIL
jgi:hypothetical protein